MHASMHSHQHRFQSIIWQPCALLLKSYLIMFSGKQTKPAKFENEQKIYRPAVSAVCSGVVVKFVLIFTFGEAIRKHVHDSIGPRLHYSKIGCCVTSRLYKHVKIKNIDNEHELSRSIWANECKQK